MTKTGRPPKTAAQHKADGTFRKDRHGARAELAIRPGAPEMPDDLDEDGIGLWQKIIETLPAEVLSELDSYGLADCCRWWSVMVRCHRFVRDNPADKESISLLNTATNHFHKYSAKFGLSPVDRARLKSPPKQDDEFDPIAAVLKMTAG